MPIYVEEREFVLEERDLSGPIDIEDDLIKYGPYFHEFLQGPSDHNLVSSTSPRMITTMTTFERNIFGDTLVDHTDQVVGKPFEFG